MTEVHTIKFLPGTFIPFNQFALKKGDKSKFEVGNDPDLYFAYKDLAYKLTRVGGERGTLQPNGRFHFSHKTKLIFENRNPDLKEKQDITIIITNDPLAVNNLTLAT